MKLKTTQISEAEALLNLFSSKKTVKYTNFRSFSELDELLAFLHKFLNINLNEPLQYGPYSIYVENKLIGLCGAQQIDKEAGKSEIWYILHPDYWGKDLAKQAVQLILARCRKNPLLKVVYAEAVSKNIASWKVLEHFDFELVKEVKDGFQKAKLKADLRCYELNVNNLR